jgi:phosphonate transport system ATP-binding protein
VILADEPIASLDPRNARLVMDALREVNRRDGLTVLCNLHHLDTARAYCGRIVAMQSGRVVFDGTPAELTAARARDLRRGRGRVRGAGRRHCTAVLPAGPPRRGARRRVIPPPLGETEAC